MMDEDDDGMDEEGDEDEDMVSDGGSMLTDLANVRSKATTKRWMMAWWVEQSNRIWPDRH